MPGETRKFLHNSNVKHEDESESLLRRWLRRRRMKRMYKRPMSDETRKVAEEDLKFLKGFVNDNENDEQEI